MDLFDIAPVKKTHEMVVRPKSKTEDIVVTPLPRGKIKTNIEEMQKRNGWTYKSALLIKKFDLDSIQNL